MYAAAYDAESTAFTSWVIKRSFERTGIWPFSTQRLIALTEENEGLLDQQDETEQTNSIVQTV